MDSPGSNTIVLATPVQYLKGIGPRRAQFLARVGVETVEDLLGYFPRRYLDRSHVTKIRQIQTGQDVTVVGQILSFDIVRGRAPRFVVLVGDGTGIVQCIWFRATGWIAKAFEIGETVAFSGRVTTYRGPQLVHPEFDKLSDKGDTDPLHTGGVIPLYPSTEFLVRCGLDSRGFRRIIRQALTSLSETIPETLNADILKRLNLSPIEQAMADMHFPATISALTRAQRRFKFEELFFIQLFLAQQRKRRTLTVRGIAFHQVGEQTRKLVERLPFSLTAAQKRVLREIRSDMKRKHPMNRLLQGDVGSGKTVVALVSMLIAVENGYQTALMAPTEILAEQHFLTIHSWLEDLGIRVALLKGGQRSVQRREVLGGIQSGDVDVAVGTHALVQEGVDFRRLGFVVIDEQHRFGVMQRAALRYKGVHPDVLVMTATPIPRTLALTLYGDLDVSVLDELPEGRIPVRTVWRNDSKRQAVYHFIRDEVRSGRQAYIVYPLVEESEKLDLKAATEGFKILSEQIFPDCRLALLHGRMKGEEKEKVMRAFKSGDVDVLVSTTVVEVGVDVTNATIMMIEHAERFGLTQLHQLRGRVGRGSDQATCILMTEGHFTDEARKRIETMTSTTDGFCIAEVDLEMRGPGEFFGTRQHGELNLRVANLATDGQILQTARDEAFRLVEMDPKLEQPENAAIHRAYTNHLDHHMGLLEVG